MKIAINFLGQIKNVIDVKSISGWKSKLFEIPCDKIFEQQLMDVDHFRDDYEVPNDVIINASHQPQGVDVTILIIDQPLERNYYIHRLSNNMAVISIYPVKEVLYSENIRIESYLIRCIYEIVCFWYERENLIHEEIYKIPHHETRGCLFDMNVIIEDIRFSAVQPAICDECNSRLTQRNLPNNFIKTLKKELMRIKKPLYYRIFDKVKERPILALFITSFWALLLSVAGSYICEKLVK